MFPPKQHFPSSLPVPLLTILLLLLVPRPTSAAPPPPKRPSGVTYCPEPHFRGDCTRTRNWGSETGNWNSCRYLSPDGSIPAHGSIAVHPNGKCILFAADGCDVDEVPKEKQLTLSWGTGNTTSTLWADVAVGGYRYANCFDA